MSRMYSMAVTVKGFNPGKRAKMEKAAEAEWAFDGWCLAEKAKTLTASGDGSLCGGETEDEFAARVAKAVMRANGGPCEVEVHATDMENLPCETYSFDEGDWEGWGSGAGRKGQGTC